VSLLARPVPPPERARRRNPGGFLTPFRWIAVAALAGGCSLPRATAGGDAGAGDSGSATPSVALLPSGTAPLIHIPYLPVESAFASRQGRFYEMAVFWFGKITEAENYVDVRLAYSDRDLFVHVAVVDRRLWYDPDASAEELTQWDGVSLFLSPGTGEGGQPDPRALDLIAQASPEVDDSDDFQAAMRWEDGAWHLHRTGFATIPGWRGDAFNTEANDLGWTMSFEIPFLAIGLDHKPVEGEQWALAVALHDRDDGSAGLLPDQVWPAGMNPTQTATWGRIEFGLPAVPAPTQAPTGRLTLQDGVNGVRVADGAVGGHTGCGAGLDPWTEWGETVWNGMDQFNIQNQRDIADWPCFSKFYITFPLDSIPDGAAITSAALVLHQFGGSGTDPGCPSLPNRSLIQVFTVGEDWDPGLLSWNTAPLPMENVSQAWVEPHPTFTGWPGIEARFDLSRAVAQAFESGGPLRLALYSADSGCHSGKYFSASEAGDWNAAARPALEVEWAAP